MNRTKQVSTTRATVLTLAAALCVAVLSGCGAQTATSSNPSDGGSKSTPGALTADPTTVSFGSLVVGSSTNQTAHITNAGPSQVTISQATVTGSGYSVSGINVPLELPAGQTLTYTASYTPSSAGRVNGSLTLVSDASNSSLAIVLSGTGIAPGQLSVSPSTLSFGSVNVGQSKSLGGTVTAGSTDITVSSANLNGTAFSLSGITLPKTISAGQSANFTITFAPNSSGTSSGSVSFVSNASNSPGKTNLSGTGVQVVAPHSVSLSWMESSGTVQGYYVYRGGRSGGPYSRISSLLPLATYSDASVVSGSTYYYVVTAVGTNSVESGYSNQAVAVVP